MIESLSPNFAVVYINTTCLTLNLNSVFRLYVSGMLSVAVIISAVVVSAGKPQYVETFNVAPDDVEIHDQSVRTSFSPYHETWRQYKIDYGQLYIALLLNPKERQKFYDKVIV